MLPTEQPHTISKEMFERGKKILASSAGHNAEWVEDQVALMMVGRLKEAYKWRQEPTEPPMYKEFMGLSAKDQRETTEPEFMRVKAYLFQKHNIELFNKDSLWRLKNELLPAYKRMMMLPEGSICKVLISQHEQNSTEIRTMDFDEMQNLFDREDL